MTFRADGEPLIFRTVNGDQVHSPSSIPTKDTPLVAQDRGAVDPTPVVLTGFSGAGLVSNAAPPSDLVAARARTWRLHSLSGALSKATSMDDVLAIVVREASAAFRARVTVLARVATNGTDLEIVAGSERRVTDVEQYDFPFDVGDGRVSGSLTMWIGDETILDDDDQTLAAAMATECAAAVERTYLVDYVRRAQLEADAARSVADDANRSKSDFLAVMSHELRTPLNAIAGYAELIELGVHGPISPQQLDAVQRIQRSQRHLLGLINAMLNYARLETGGVHYDTAVLRLDDVIADCTALIAPQAASKRLRIVVGKGDRALSAWADSDKVQQVLLNLLSNAIKFTEPEGTIWLDYYVRSSLAVIEIVDTGRGIASNQLERVFEPFVQVDSRLTRTHGGVGLGLSISRNLARGMGGDLRVDSVLGFGSRFTLTLPAANVP